MLHYLLKRNTAVYIAVFFIGFATLSVEVTLTRLLSVISYYYFAFFAVSAAMLGITAGAVMVSVNKKKFTHEQIYKSLDRSSLAFGLSTIISVFGVCLIPVGPELTLMKGAALLALTFFSSLPFYFSGIITTAVLTKLPLPVRKLYASDLMGAAFGCLFVLAGLRYFDAPSLIIFSGVFGIAASLLFRAQSGYSLFDGKTVLLLVIILFLSFTNRFTHSGIRPITVKGKLENPDDYLLEKWNSFSRVVLSQKKIESPQLWGPSPVTPPQVTEQYMMSIDGDAGTVLRKFNSPADGLHLQYDLTAIAYFLRDNAETCVIGVGAGKDVQTAIFFHAKRITGIDINPVFINLLQHEFGKFSGIASHSEVSLIVDDARSYLSRPGEKYDIIQMSLVDTWASTGAGAFSLSENNLYTVEAWQTFFNRLKSNGLFIVSRWYDPLNTGETGRLLSLAMAGLLKHGIKEPAKHIVLLSINNLSTIILSKAPFDQRDLMILDKKVGELKFNTILSPQKLPENPLLKTIITSGSLKALQRGVKNYPLNFNPPTDENPYFFNMLKISRLNFQSVKNSAGIMRGNLLATVTLILLIVCLATGAFFTILMPLISKTKNSHLHPLRLKNAYGAFYFSLIGAGFMLVEIALIQWLSVFLGHPVYALGILLFSMILSTGFGSLSSEKIIIWKKNALPLYPLLAALFILGLKFFIPVITTNMAEQSIGIRIFVTILLVFPLGICLGLFFPMGMKMVRKKELELTPWYWGLNGIFGVLFSAIAVLVSIYIGISINFYLAAVMYASLFIIIQKLVKNEMVT